MIEQKSNVTSLETYKQSKTIARAFAIARMANAKRLIPPEYTHLEVEFTDTRLKVTTTTRQVDCFYVYDKRGADNFDELVGYLILRINQLKEQDARNHSD